MARTVHVIPHTHWDREWYRTFQSFRMELVDLVDETLDLLETNPDYTCFMLDGQMAVVDDYLAIRPENRERLVRLAEADRLMMGPWYILMDEFLVSGETIVRDMQLGLSRAEAFGGAMPVGYLPDMFGHIAQMPQILAGFGFQHTVVWRGVPSPMTDHASFTWEGLDGSSVTAQYLPRGYGNGVDLPADADALIRRVELFTEQTGTRSGSESDPVLWMHGTDHRHPLPALPAMIATANKTQTDWHFVVSSLPDYIAEQTTARPASTRWRGELRSGARANLLMGVTSNRVDVKQAAARAERALERLAEPLCALLLAPEQWPTAFLGEAWRLMIQNSAHDSICACSHDDVVEAVRSRFAEAQAIADGLIERAQLTLLRKVPGGMLPGGGPGAVVMNTSSRQRSGLIELTLPAGVDAEGTQLLRDHPARLPMHTVAVGEAIVWMDVVEDHLGDVYRVDVTELDDGNVDVDLLMDSRRFGLLDATDARTALRRAAEANPNAQVHFWISGVSGRKVLAHVDAVPGFGWSTWRPGPLPIDAVHAEGHTMGNGLVTIEVAADGSFALNGHGGLGRLVDEGDAGDTYNWCPPTEDIVIDSPDDVVVSIAESGPLRARLRIDTTYSLPTRVAGGRREGSTSTTISTVLELRAGESCVHVATSFDNHSRDHRLRAVFALPEPAATSHAECAFGVVERGLHVEGGLTETGLATQPSRRFVTAGGLTIAHEGLLEYELVYLHGEGDSERAHGLALTLLRATGLLSQAPMATRTLPAGPIQRLEGPQLQGRVAVRYAVSVGDHDPYRLVDDAFLPLIAAGTASGPAPDDAPSTAPPGGSLLEVTGAEVSALRRVAADPGLIEVRVFNPTADEVTVTITDRTGNLVDLAGTKMTPFDGSFTLRPWGIQTVHLTE